MKAAHRIAVATCLAATLSVGLAQSAQSHAEFDICSSTTKAIVVADSQEYAEAIAQGLLTQVAVMCATQSVGRITWSILALSSMLEFADVPALEDLRRELQARGARIHISKPATN